MAKDTSTFNHEKQITGQAQKFINAWFNKAIDEQSPELGDHFFLPGGKTLDKKAVVERIKRIFNSAEKFIGGRFDVVDASFEILKDGKGIGSAEGAVGYRATYKNNSNEIVSGPFKLYFALEKGSWKIVHIVFPSFVY